MTFAPPPSGDRRKLQRLVRDLHTRLSTLEEMVKPVMRAETVRGNVSEAQKAQRLLDDVVELRKRLEGAL